MEKKEKHSEMPKAERDDALFEMLGKNKKRKKRRILMTVGSILLVAAIAAVVSVTVLRQRVRDRFAFGQGEVLSYDVTTGSISTLVSGSGNLTDVDLEAITVPAGVEITEVKVEQNQSVEKGDILANVDMASVISAMADLQTQIEKLDKQLSAAEDDAAATAIKAGVTGRVKAVFGEKDADVADVMYTHGALALLSLDGYMAVDVETDALAVGDSVSVKLSDGKEISGTVESVADGQATILVTDNGPKYEDAVAVLNGEGQQLGTGKLYIHSALRVTGYAGTISGVSAVENGKVYASTKLFTLKDTSYSANYNSLLRQRAELEETLLELLTIQRDGAVLAQMNGSVYSVDHSDITASAVATLSADEKMSVTFSVDESDILALELGQMVSVTVKSVSEDAFDGTLTEINRSSASGTYSAVIELEKAEGMLSGMSANVNVRIEGVDDAILVPVEAVHKTSEGAYVYTSYDEENQEYGDRVDVVTGLENSNYVEIKSGLHLGDTVYYTEQKSIFGNFGGMGGNNGGGKTNAGQKPASAAQTSGRPGNGGGAPGGVGG